jgi:thymidylate kinase
MREVPFSVWEHVPNVEARNGRILRVEQPVVLEIPGKQGFQQRRIREPNAYFLEKVALDSRVLIIEGISGAGKDTFQAYLKKKLKGRDVYDYSEGEVLNSWKQFQIEGILELRVKFMKVFLNYVRDVVSREENAVFLLNRFHLSTYAWTINQQPKLQEEYDEIVNVLKTLPVHTFILQLDENEIETRSLHPERSGVWQKFKQQIVDKGNDSFRTRLEKQQKLMLEAAKRQQIPYSLIKLKLANWPETGNKQVRISQVQRNVPVGVRMRTSVRTKLSTKKRYLPATL